MKKIYIEISDICGLKCDFCPAPKGVRGVMDLALFRKAVLEARHFTRLIALHILGDPLKIGNLAEYLQIAKEANLSVEITTSGANLSDFDLLLCAPIKQVNFSLDAIRTLKNAPFLLRRICDFCKYKVQKKSEIFINLRVQKRAENAEIVEFLAQNLASLSTLQNLAQNRIKLGNKIIIDFREVFEWNIEDNAINAESSADSATRTPLISFNSFAKGLHPSPRSPYAPKAPLFAFRESASLSPLLAKNQRSHYCSLDSDFLHHEAGEFSGASHNSFLDSAESQNLGENQAKIAESSADSATRTQEANSKIVDEFLHLCEASDKDRTNSSSRKRALRKCEKSSRAEFAKGTCLALKTHLGILADGTIVPCCIDALGNLALGNIKEISLDSALKGARAQKMLRGFRENRLVEHFCQKCDYKNRFT